MAPLRIMLADDHGIVREGLRALINAEPDMEVVGEASDGLAVLPEAQMCQPDVVIVDVSMPVLSGVSATRQIKHALPHIRVVALSANEDRKYLRDMLEAGATGYVLKRALATDLLHAVRVVAAGGVYLDTALAGTVIETLRAAPPAHTPAPLTLSPREERVARMIAQGYTTKEIASDLKVSVKTVDTYKNRAMEKLGLDNRVALVRYALQHGWLQVE